jgi:hypothetical protein
VEIIFLLGDICLLSVVPTDDRLSWADLFINNGLDVFGLMLVMADLHCFTILHVLNSFTTLFCFVVVLMSSILLQGNGIFVYFRSKFCSRHLLYTPLL